MNARPTAGGGHAARPDRHRFVVSGSHGAASDRRDPYQAAFTAEEEARQAFVRFRLACTSAEAWGQLVAEDGERERAERLCWFGNPPRPEPAPEPPSEPTGTDPAGGGRPARRRWYAAFIRRRRPPGTVDETKGGV